jgi:hypothetical protein
MAPQPLACGYKEATRMPLTSGTKLGPYARDTRLDRTVAVKVLASDLSSSPELSSGRR